MYKLLLISVIFLFNTQILKADSFEITANVTKVMGYAKNTNYEADQCLVYFNVKSPSVCNWKTRAVILTDTGIGDLMCSMAMTALVSGKKVTIGSHDDNCNLHSSPVIRFLTIIN